MSLAKGHADDIVRLAQAQNPVEAHIWEQALLDEGIQCKVVGDYLDAGLGDIAGIRPEVWVHRDDVIRAEEIIRRGYKPATDEADEPDEES